MISQKRAFGAAIWSAVEQIGGQGVSTIFFLAFARVLTPEDFGIVAAGMIITGFATRLAIFGLDTAIVQKPDLDPREFSTFVWITLGLSVMLASLMVVFGGPVSQIFGDTRVAGIMPLLAVAMVATSVAATLAGLLRRELEMKALAKRTVLANLMSGAIATPFVFLDFGYWALIIQSTGGASMTLLLTYAMVRMPVSFGFDQTAARKILRFGAPIAASDLLATYNRDCPRLFVGLFLGVEALGIFSIGLRVMNLLLQVVGVAFSKVTLPVLAEVNRSSPEKMNGIYFRLVRIAGTVMMPVFLMAIVFRDVALETLLGPQWGAAAPIIAFLCAAGLLSALTYINGSAIVALGYPAGRLKYGLLRAAVGTVLLLIATPFGAIYAAAAFFLRNLIVEPLQLGYLLRRLGAGYADYLRSLKGVAVAACALVVAGSAMMALLPEWDAPWLLLAGVAVSGLSFGLVLLLVEPGIRHEVSSLTGRET